MQILEDKSIEVHVLMRRFTREEVLTELNCEKINADFKDKTADFLINLFYQKDKNLENFYSNCVLDKDKDNRIELFNIKFKDIIFGISLFSLSTAYLLKSHGGRKLFCEIYIFGALVSLLRI